MTKVGPRPKGPSRRELRQLSKNGPAPGLTVTVSSSSSVAIQQQSAPPISFSGSRSSNSIYLDVSNRPSRRLLPRSKKAGGRHKPILVPQHSVNSPPRLRRISLTSAHKRRRSQEISTETDELLKAFQARVQRTALDIKEKRAELMSLRLQTKPESPTKTNIFSLATPRTTPPDAPVFAPPRPVQPHQSTPAQMLPTPDDTPLGPIEASSPIAACTPRLSPAFDDPFVSGASPPATASPYLKALSTASPDLRAPRIQRPNDVGSRIPRPMSLTAIPLHVVDSPLRVPDTPVPSGLDTPRVLVHASDKVSVSLSPLVSNVSASKDYSCDIAQSVGSPVAEANEKAKLDTLADSKQTAGPLSLSSPVLNAATASARPVRPAQANEKRKSCPPRASTRPAIDRSSTIAPARQISRASSLRIVPPVSSQPKPTRVTSSYYQKENHRKPELGNAGKSKPLPPTCRSPQTAPAALEKTRIQPLKRTSSVTSTRPVREGRAPTGPPPKGPATKRVTVCSTVNQAPISNLIRTAKPVERARSIRGTKPAPPFPASSPAAIANAVPASLLATSSSGSIFPSVNNDVDLEAGDTVIEMQRQGVASGLPLDGDAGVAHTPRKSTGLRGFAKMVGEALSSPFKPAKASAPTRVWR